MTRAAKITAAVTLTVLAAAAVLSCLVLRRSGSQTVEIVQDGTVIRTFDPAAEPDQELRIVSADGSSYNTVRIRDGRVCVSEAGCPDQTCVHMGELRSDSLPIVCLPNRLVVRFAEDGA